MREDSASGCPWFSVSAGEQVPEKGVQKLLVCGLMAVLVSADLCYSQRLVIFFTGPVVES